MTLSDNEIIMNVNLDLISIFPFKKDNVQPASYDLRLGRDFLKIKEGQIITSKKEVEYVRLNEKGIILEPNDFILGTTLEKIKLPDNIVGQLSGKSSWGRRGLKIENAGFIEQFAKQEKLCAHANSIKERRL